MRYCGNSLSNRSPTIEAAGQSSANPGLLGDDYPCSEAALRHKMQCSVCGSGDVVVRVIGPSGDSDSLPEAQVAILAEV